MTDSLAQAAALVLLASGITIVADVILVGDTTEAGHYIKRDMDLIRVRPSNWVGADWAQAR